MVATAFMASSVGPAAVSINGGRTEVVLNHPLSRFASSSVTDHSLPTQSSPDGHGPELMWSDRQHYVSTAEQSSRVAAAAASPGYGMGFGGGGAAANRPVIVSITDARISGRLEMGADGLMTLVDGRIDQAFTDQADAAHYAGV